MGFFKSNCEKTSQALRDAASACNQEAETKFKQLMFAYEKGRVGDNDPYISAFKELYKIIFGYSINKNALLFETSGSNGYLFPQACVYYIYLNLMISFLRGESNKYLSEDALKEVEQKGWNICGWYSALHDRGFLDKVDAYTFGTRGDTKFPKHPTVADLFLEKFNLVEGY